MEGYDGASKPPRFPLLFIPCLRGIRGVCTRYLVPRKVGVGVGKASGVTIEQGPSSGLDSRQGTQAPLTLTRRDFPLLPHIPSCGAQRLTGVEIFTILSGVPYAYLSRCSVRCECPAWRSVSGLRIGRGKPDLSVVPMAHDKCGPFFWVPFFPPSCSLPRS